MASPAERCLLVERATPWIRPPQLTSLPICSIF
jgi:hypothetical protein